MTELPHYTVTDPALLHALRAGTLDPLVLRGRLIAGASDRQATTMALYEFEEGARALRRQRVIIEGAPATEAPPFQAIAVVAVQESDPPNEELSPDDASERPMPAGRAREPLVRILVDPPPRLMMRCATPLLSASTTREDATRLVDAWQEDDRRWLAWYARQPAGWLREHHHATAERCRHRLEPRPPVPFLDAPPHDTRLVPIGPGISLVAHGLTPIRRRTT